MKKFYRIVLLSITFVFLTTYNSGEIESYFNKEISFFRIKNIKIINNYIINEKDVEAKLKDIYGKSIFSVKRHDLEEPLKSFYFLEKIEVKKKYPNTLIIKIYETKPIAILFKNNENYLLDSQSNLIPLNENVSKEKLPYIFGIGAENEFMNLFKLLENSNFPKKRIKNYYYFQIGRWDLQLHNEQTIKLPADKTKEAIQQSIQLLNKKNFKNFNVIDLRIHGRITVE